MFDRLLKFFIVNHKLNYAIFFLVYALGIYSYIHLPKEISPVIEPDSITIRGHYNGASIDSLNSMAVGEVESQVRNIDGVKSITSVITSGKFSTVVELKSDADKDKILKEIEDAIKVVKINLPNDMDEPTVRSMAHSRSLLNVSIFSQTKSRDELIKLANYLKDKISYIKDVSGITIYGDADKIYEILIDEDKIKAYNFSVSDVIQAISELSYIYPLGKVDNHKDKFFISINSVKDTSNLADALLIVDDRTIKLSDIAKVVKRYDDSNTLASMNGENSITLAISQNTKGDAITIVNDIKKFIDNLHIKGVDFKIKRDKSTVIKENLNIVISNILFGIILILLLMSVLINYRIAFVIALGIPTSFILGSIYFYVTGFSINVNSLVGVLLAIGIIVDDAIVVSENIYQYIQKGYSATKSAYLGAKEMAKPVTIASLTTVFSFIPLLMIDGRLGNIISLIPIALSALVLASLIESFVFLPIHSVHIFKNDTKTLSWDRLNLIYLNILRFFTKYKKSFLIIFFIVVPLLTYLSVKNLRFFMFSSFDSSSISITFKAKPSTSLEESLAIVQTIEKDLLKQKDKFFIKDISSTAGYRRSATGGSEMYPYVGSISIELYKKAPSNFVDRYITPNLSFYYDKENRIREIDSRVLSKQIRGFVRVKKYKKRFDLKSINVVERRLGHTKADIRIGIVSDNYKKSLKALYDIEKELSKTKGIKFFGDNVSYGIDEVKIKLNNYGQRLGLSERYISTYISNIFLERKIGVIYDKKNLVDIKIKSSNYNDIESLKNIQIPLKNGTFIPLIDICDISREKALEKLTKDYGDTTFFVFANIIPKLTTDAKVLKKLEPIMQKYKKLGVKFKLKGEAYQKKRLKTKMTEAIVLAIVLIFISILYLFNSIRNTLIVMSVIPLSLFGVFVGHNIMGLNLTLPSLIGALGLAGVIINDGIIMMDTIKDKVDLKDILDSASRRLRPIILTTITTIAGLSSLMFFATGDAEVFQPIAVSLGFGLIWGTVLNLVYLPIFYIALKKDKII
ncbi:MAG: efflux RND transporter permease subunit [Campylobacterales bacterium]